MRFVKGGPEVPDRLVQKHEDGGVVFFCGAGISYPAGLPGFRDLVHRIFDGLGERFDAIEKAAMDGNRFDAVLDLLERRLGSNPVRQRLWRELQPDLTRPGAKATHEALLTLARTQSDVYRLITTNFDRIFFEIKADLPQFAAPLLPVPKQSVWDGIVYLHGLLPVRESEATRLARLVVSSGDFGRAYLTERWASRFVTELFRDYSVCFVGYSIDDPVLRYMLDAISADRVRGENVPEMYAFGATTPARVDRDRDAWKAKGVTPILYNTNKRIGHNHLHDTLRQWAEDYRLARHGQVATVTTYARKIPSKVRGDHVVERMLWAITDRSAVPAREFAKLDPPPPIQWLSVFSDLRYEGHDLPRFGVLPDKREPKKTTPFSVVSRPAPYYLSAKMAIAEPYPFRSPWDEVMYQLAYWLSKHLGAKDLLGWVLKNGGALHPNLREIIRRELQTAKLSAPLRAIWMVLSSDQVSYGRHFERSFFDLAREATALGWTPAVQREFLKALRPLVTFRAPIRLRDEPVDPDERLERVRHYVSWDLTLPIGAHAEQTLGPLKATEGYSAALIEMLPALTQRLKEALDLSAQLEGADATHDLGYIHRPSISDHAQNRDYEEWTILISFCRDAWLEANRLAPALAKATFEYWKCVEYPMFRRLVLFAAAHAATMSVPEKIDLLLEREGWWLWSVETQREMFRLLDNIAQGDPPRVERLLDAILLGPPRDMFNEGLSAEDWSRIVLRSIWLRLAKLRHFGLTLSVPAQRWWDAAVATDPNLELQADDRDEFPYYMTVGAGVAWRTQTTLPQDRVELVEALKQRPEPDFHYSDDWHEVGLKAPKRAIAVLMRLARDQVWRADIWGEALNSFREEKAARLSWLHLHRALLGMPEDVASEITDALAAWLHSAAKFVGEYVPAFFYLLDAVLNVAKNGEGDAEHPVTRAINQPVGKIAEALLNWWYTTNPQAGDGLREPLKERLTRITQQPELKFRDGRVLLGAHLHPLFLVDAEWAKTNLLPRFHWETDATEARAVWEGYLWSPRISPQLLSAFKPDLLATTSHYAELGDHAAQFASFFTYVAVELNELFTKQELITAFNTLTADALAKGAHAVSQMLIDAGEPQQKDRWTSKIKPFLMGAWPKSRNLRSSPESSALALVIIHSGAFLDAFRTLHTLLVPANNTYLPVLSLSNSNCRTSFQRKCWSYLG